MNLGSVAKSKMKGKRRIGRGPGTGRGKTSGRGTKGQKARGNLAITHSHYEGGQRPLFKRLPYRRGKGNRKISKKPIVVNIGALNVLPKNSVVDIDTLVKYNIVDKNDAKIYGVKILGNGDLNIDLKINLPASASVLKRIEKSRAKSSA